MTVKELIEKLKEFPEDWDVYTPASDIKDIRSLDEMADHVEPHPAYNKVVIV